MKFLFLLNIADFNSEQSFQNDVKELKKKLRSTEDDYKRSQSDTSKYLSTLKDVQSRVSSVIARTERKEESETPEESSSSGGLNGKSEDKTD